MRNEISLATVFALSIDVFIANINFNLLVLNSDPQQMKFFERVTSACQVCSYVLTQCFQRKACLLEVILWNMHG